MSVFKRLVKLFKRSDSENGSESDRESKSDNGKVKYILLCNIGTKREKVKEYDYLPDYDQVYEDITNYGKEGTYWLQEMIDGRFGKVVFRQDFKFVKGDVSYDNYDELEELLELEETAGRKRRRKKKDFIDELNESVEKLNKFVENLERIRQIGIRLANVGNVTEDDVIRKLEELRAKYDRLEKLFGYSRVRSEDVEVPVKGEIPAWAVYMPRMLERMLDSVEKRMRQWGLIGGIGGTSEKMPEFPKFPSE